MSHKAAPQAAPLKMPYRANEIASALLLETGVPKALGIYLEHGLCPGPHQRSPAGRNDVALNN